MGDEEDGRVGEVGAEGVILRVRDVDLAPGDPAARQPVLVLVIVGIRSCGFRRSACELAEEEKRLHRLNLRLETVYGTQNMYGTASAKMT